MFTYLLIWRWGARQNVRTHIFKQIFSVQHLKTQPTDVHLLSLWHSWHSSWVGFCEVMSRERSTVCNEAVIVNVTGRLNLFWKLCLEVSTCTNCQTVWQEFVLTRHVSGCTYVTLSAPCQCRVSRRHLIVIVNQLQINRLLIKKKTKKPVCACLISSYQLEQCAWGRSDDAGFSGSNCSLQIHFRINCYWSLAYWQLSNSLGVNLSKHIPTSTAQTPFLTQKLSAYISQKLRTTSFFFQGHDSETHYHMMFVIQHPHLLSSKP